MTEFEKTMSTANDDATQPMAQCGRHADHRDAHHGVRSHRRPLESGKPLLKTAEMAVVSADSVRMYMKEIGEIDLLSAAEEVELAKRIEAGRLAEQRLADDSSHEGEGLSRGERRRLEREVQEGHEAMQHLVSANLRLVVSNAKYFANRGVAFLDLIQEGNLGLMRAAEKFDYHLNYRFSTYATWWIRQALNRAVDCQGRTIRIPVHMAEIVTKIGRVQRDLLQELGHEATPEEVAEAMGMTPERVTEIMCLTQDAVSLDVPIGEDEESHLGDMVEDTTVRSPFEEVELTSLREDVAAVLQTLSDKERTVLELRFGLQDDHPRTLEEVGGMLGVTRERIRQIEVTAVAKLRHPSRSKKLADYAGAA